MHALRKGRYLARFASGAADLAAAQALRAKAFSRDQPDGDRFDPLCDHVLIQTQENALPLCCFRLMPLKSGRDLGQSYSAQFYDLDALQSFGGAMLELGRFCVRPGLFDADILRLAFAMVTQVVDARDARLLFGCSSFAGTDPSAHADAFGLLQRDHLAPAEWAPVAKARETVPLIARDFERDTALRAMPPLLRSYLSMGGWVSDHAVVDRDLNTLHVFTGVQISAIPSARAETLRAVAGLNQGSN